MISVQDLQAAITQRISDFNLTDSPLNLRGTVSAQISQHLSASYCSNSFDKYALNPIKTQALGAVLAEPVYSSIDIPRQNLSAMDGYAIVKGSQLIAESNIEIVGESQAGKPFSSITNQPLQAGQGVRIFTGAVVPADCDTVVMQEKTNHQLLTAERPIDKDSLYTIKLTKLAIVGSNIRNQGEEIQTGELILSAGKRLNPTDISLLASLGFDSVQVYQPIKVGILATGDELVEVGNPLENLSQIYNSNTPTLKSLLRYLPIEIIEYSIIPDDLSLTKQAVKRAMQQCDVVISTAGVSVGDYDYLTEVINELGTINHYKVAMKPGKPFVFGELTQSLDKPVFFFGLPGNPLSTVVGCQQFVIPSLWQLAGVAIEDVRQPFSMKAILQNKVKKSAGRADFQRGILSQIQNGDWQVDVFDHQQSHRVKQLAKSNCLVVFDQDNTGAEVGDLVQVQPFSWFAY